MRRTLLLIILLLFALSVGAQEKRRPGGPGHFCITGWSVQSTSHYDLPGSGHCVFWEIIYYCDDTGLELDCQHVSCDSQQFPEDCELL